MDRSTFITPTPQQDELGKDGDEIIETSEKTSTIATFFVFLKSYLGSGIMGMAAAYLSGGAILTTILIFVIAVLSCFCFNLLFRVRDRLITTTSLPIESLHFETVVEAVLGKWGRYMTVSALIFTQAGFATAYIIFIANNLNLLYPMFSYRIYATMLILPVMVLCWIRQIKFLNPFAMAGILAYALAVGTVSYYCVEDIRANQDLNLSEIFLRMDWLTVPISFGVVVYLFEGIGLILPLEQKMKDPSQFVYVMWGVHLSVAFFVSLFGLLGLSYYTNDEYKSDKNTRYVAFYLCTRGPIILNLPNGGPLVTVTIWTLNVCLLFTYPIQMVPVFQIAEDALMDFLYPRCDVSVNINSTIDMTNSDQTNNDKIPLFSAKENNKNRKKKIVHFYFMSVRAVIVLISYGCAVGIPSFDLFLSLIGGLGSAQLMFIIPPIVYLVCFSKEISFTSRVLCYLLLLFGIATLVITTVFTLIHIVHSFTGGGTGNNTLCNNTHIIS